MRRDVGTPLARMLPSAFIGGPTADQIVVA
jgi:hypothetical protein